MHSTWATVFASIAGSGTLLLFYIAVKTEWPSNYVSVDTDFGVVINRSFARYFLFTAAPTYLVTLVASTLATRSGGHPVICGLVIAAAHILANNGRHLVRVVRYRRDQARYALLIVDGLNIFVVIGAALLGSLGPGRYKQVVPSASDFFSSLWTSTFVAIVAVCLLHLTQRRITPNRLVQRSAKETRKLRDHALQAAALHDVDPAVVISILYTENLQRPGWVRTLERIKGRVWKPGTYGAMQVSTDHPISDAESIDIAVSRYLTGVRISADDAWEQTREIFESYNNNPEFVSLATTIYWEVAREFEKDQEPRPVTDDNSDQDEAVTPDPGPNEDAQRAVLAVALRRVLEIRFPDSGAVSRAAAEATILQLRAALSALVDLPTVQSDADLRTLAEVREILGEATDH